MTIIVWTSKLEERTLKYKFNRLATGVGSAISGISLVGGFCAYTTSMLGLGEVNPKVAIAATVAGLVGTTLCVSGYVNATDRLSAIGDLQMDINYGNIPANINDDKKLDNHIELMANKKREDRATLARSLRYNNK